MSISWDDSSSCCCKSCSTVALIALSPSSIGSNAKEMAGGMLFSRAVACGDMDVVVNSDGNMAAVHDDDDDNDEESAASVGGGGIALIVMEGGATVAASTGALASQTIGVRDGIVLGTVALDADVDNVVDDMLIEERRGGTDVL